MKYIRNLKNVEQKATGRTNTILSVSTQTHKQGRPFLGILVLVNERKYCIPLSSVEEKEKYKSITLPYLKSLPMDTIILPGHGDPFIITESKFLWD